jgi:hypothetical protein
MSETNGVLEHLYQLVGNRAVLLPIPRGTKNPITTGWQETTFDVTRTDDYQFALQTAIDAGGNIGVLQGPHSENLISIDIDNDSDVEPFLELNTQLHNAPRTRGARGCQIHLRMMSAKYPRSINYIKKADGSKWGEFRGGPGSQSIIHGVHPNGNLYSTIVDHPVIEIDFEQIIWPASLVLPWMEKKQSPAAIPAKISAPTNIRIAAYLSRIPCAVSGNGGHSQTLWAATSLVNGWGLSIEEAKPYLQSYNQRCEPPWTDKELNHKLSEAERLEDKSRKGHLLLEDIPAKGQDKPSAEEPPKPENPWLNFLTQSACTSKSLRKMEFKPRLPIVGDWFLQGDLGFIFAPRGLGKTWFSMLIAQGIATGRIIGPWNVTGTRRVMYMDGEMPPDSVRDRDTSLGAECENLIYLNHQILFEKTGQILNLANLQTQEGITTFLLDNGVQVLFLDNLSTLVSGVQENTADDWEVLQGWLLQLRRHGVSVVWIHHSGRDAKNMRGNSKREDPAFWVIRLEVADEEDTSVGARFVSHFTKNRNTPVLPCHYEWRFEPDGNQTHVTAKEASVRQLFRRYVEEGIATATELSDTIGCSPGLISRLAKQGEKEGWMTIKNRRYETK